MPRLSDYLASQAETPLVDQHQQQQNQPTALEVERAVARFAAQHERRVIDHGPRQYQQPDGSLSAGCPPASPYTLASRAVWRDLVSHCRTSGGDAHYARSGWSLRHFGLRGGVDHASHVAYLSAAGLAPEEGRDGRTLGLDLRAMDLMADPRHPFNDAGGGNPWHAVACACALFVATPRQWHDAGDEWLEGAALGSAAARAPTS
ncbi:hypothetical protein FOA52_005778 [Chlamydomonas sp. UWO 241]|nr:hypothetical protein FOA52_005778 [Chlamydomonas sp. UWO 241]